jgi:aminoglycoside phosphotransferase (APT) family kinase protein
MAADVPGTLLGAGRSADVYDVGNGRVLRRYRDGRRAALVDAEARVMVHARAGGGIPGLVLPRPFGDGDALLHRDLHPINVILTPDGPVIIDWESAACGPPIADVAMTWVIIGFSDVPGDGVSAAVVRAGQSILTRSFARAAGPLDEAWRVAAARGRLADPHVLPSEAARMRKLVPVQERV